jgi:hypothetical protein
MRQKVSKITLSVSALSMLLFSLVIMSVGCSGSSSVASGKTMTAIAVTPATASIASGASQPFTATATYSDGSTGNVTSSVTWTSSSASVATITAAGMATAVAAGSSTMTASLNGVSGAAALTVTAATKTLVSIAVSPATPSIAAGATQQFVATATYSDGSTAVVTSTAAWSSSSVGVATINAAGLATAVAAGTSTITATVSGVSGTASLTVAAKTVASIAVTPATMSIVAGTTQQFTATATYSDGSTAVVTSTATWTSSNTAVATISAAGLATGVTPGASTVTAAVGSVSGTAALTVTAKTLTSIAVTPAAPTIAVRETQQFTATATYSDGSTANVSATATWTSSSTATATINATGLTTAVAVGSSTITATVSGVSGTAALTVVAKAITSIAITPTAASFAIGSTQQFTATATYSDGSTANITSTAAWAVSNPSVATINSSGLATAVASGATSVTASESGITGNVAFNVTIAAGTGVNIPMFHVDAQRKGLNENETTLTTSNVSSATFGKLFSVLVDGYVYGTPLIMSNLTVNGATHNVLYAATENDSVFAFDSDKGTLLWQRSLLNQSGTTNEAPIGGPIAPYEGVTSTPVIDTTTNTLYVVSVQKSSNANSTAYFRLSALDITTGAITNTNVVSATVPGTNSDSSGGQTSLPTSCVQRAALLVANSNVYIGFGGCHSGWLLAYDESTLAQVGVFNMSPNDNGEGAYASAGGVWMGAGGPVSDGAGNVFVTTGNGPYDPTALPANSQTPGAGAWSDSVLRFDSTLNLEDSFTPDDFAYMDCADSDLAAGGLIMVPGTGTSPAQLVAGGKMGRLYFLNSTNLGGENGTPGQPDPNIAELEWGAAAPGQSALVTPYTQYCQLTPTSPKYYATINSFEIFGTAAYFNGSIYLGITPTNTPGPTPEVPSGIRQFTYTGGQWVPGTDTTLYTQENTRGTTPFISANGASDGILWMIDQGQPLQTPASGGPTSATLRAYNASDLSTGELYDSSQNGTADVPGYGIKFSSPVVANGKVYISTGHDLTTVPNPQGEIDVYGLN